MGVWAVVLYGFADPGLRVFASVSLIGNPCRHRGKGRAACLLRTEDGKHVRLSGKLEKGLVGLPGAYVLLEGELRPSVPYPEVDVRNYTILSISGKRPFVGVLREEDGRFLLESGEGRALELVDVGGLREGTLPKPGATLWVTGSVVGDTLHVERFGVLSP